MSVTELTIFSILLVNLKRFVRYNCRMHTAFFLNSLAHNTAAVRRRLLLDIFAGHKSSKIYKQQTKKRWQAAAIKRARVCVSERNQRCKATVEAAATAACVERCGARVLLLLARAEDEAAAAARLVLVVVVARITGSRVVQCHRRCALRCELLKRTI